MPLTEKQVPWTGPYALANNSFGHKSKGPTCEAMKRALSRAGAPSLPWTEFDQHYNQKVEQAWDWWDQKQGLTGNNGYGKGRWERLRAMPARVDGQHAGEYALDSYGQKLIQDEAGATSDSTELEVFQRYFTEFCKLAIENEDNWHYDQGRPVKLNINPSAGSVHSDCSGFGIQCADYARRKAGMMGTVQDPSKQGWSGWGNTDEYEDDWPKIGSPFRVGDAAHFHSERHVLWCHQAGNIETAKWTSHGQESGPDAVTLATYSRYPSEFMFVVRPGYIPPAV
jgi:hypothetical protein